MAERFARVFPRRTSATPSDALAFVGDPPLFRLDIAAARVSCVFTWDKPEAERLALAWGRQGYKTEIGGPAYGSPADEFVPGRYLKPGMTITSRGCIRRCDHCLVPSREGPLRLLPIVPGWDIVDNNLLACPRTHIEAVLAMLDRQPRAARFTGGIDARLCRPWFAKAVANIRLDILYTAYDDPKDADAAERAIALLRAAGLRQRQVGCYVLVGHKEDTPQQAEERLAWVKAIGGMPFAMYYRPPNDKRDRIPPQWAGLVRRWSRPAAIFAKTCQAEGG